MTATGWLSRSAAEVPAGDAWLGPAEREVLAGLRLPKRREDWRLGRWAAKEAVARWLSVDRDRVQVVPSPGGLPAPLLDGAPAPVALSLSHRAGAAVAMVGDDGASVGCDLEWVEPRSEAFVREWLAPDEQALVARAGRDGHRRVANIIWTAKEAAAKVRGEGLRLDVRGAVVALEGSGESGLSTWRPLRVTWGDGTPPTCGWWRERDGWVMAAASTVCGPPPQELS